MQQPQDQDPAPKNFTVYDGKEFNRLTQGIVFVKLTNLDENHNGFQFRTGLNVDDIKFDPSGSCKAGGLYFCEWKKVGQWIEYGNKQCMYWRKVTIPDDTQVYIEPDKFKADKFVLSDRQKIWDNEEICTMAVSYDGNYLCHIDHQTVQMQLLAVRTSISCIQYAHNPSVEVYEAAVSYHGRSLRHITNPSHKLCELAVQSDGLALEFVKNQTEKICELAVMQNPKALSFVYKQTDKICELAVQRDGSALQYVMQQTPHICELAIHNEAHALRYVNQQTDDLCETAIKKCPSALFWVHHQTEHLCELAVQRDGEALKYVLKQTQTPRICELAVAQNGSAIRFVRNPTKELCLLALKKNSGVRRLYFNHQHLTLLDEDSRRLYFDQRL
jgi:hypothetical protein